jgi:hypothetical protein
VRINEGVAMRVLLDFDADAEKIRNELIRMLSGPGPRRESAASPPRERLREDIRETIAAGDYDRAADLRERMIQLRAPRPATASRCTDRASLVARGPASGCS